MSEDDMKSSYKQTQLGPLPSNWSVRRLSSLTRSYAGGTPDRSKPEYFEGDIPWVKSGEVNKRKITGTEERISDIALRESSAKVAETGSILVAMYGATAGKIARLQIDAAINQAVLSIRTTGNELDNDYLFWVLESNAEKLLAMCQGAAQPNLSKGLIDGLEIATPPISEQIKIAAILTVVDNKLDVISRQIEATQSLKRGLMQTLFSRGVGTQDADGRWVPHSEFKDSELGEIPAEWSVTTVGDVCEVKGGKRLPKGETLTEENTGYPYIRVTDMYMGGVNTESILYVPTHIQPSIARYTISKDDIFISVAGTLGLVGVVPEELDGANLTENADKLTDIKINRDYLFYCLSSDAIQQTIAREATSNAQPKLALTRIREFSFPLPSGDEQAQIAAILAALDRKLKSLLTKHERHQELKRGLMQKLLTGEWRVTLEDTEPVAA